KGVRPFGEPLSEPIHSVLQFHKLGATADILTVAGSTLSVWTGTSWDEVGSGADDHAVSGAQFGDALYLASGGETVGRKWDGSSLTDLGQSFRDDFDAPGSGNM